jgi:dihydropteroate synthase
MKQYLRPILQQGCVAPRHAETLGAAGHWFTHVELLARGTEPKITDATGLSDTVTRPRKPVLGCDLSQPVIMGILNVTPDSFSDGGKFDTLETAVNQARQMVADGAHILDVGGESTRPGAANVDIQEEIGRTAPVIRAIRDAGIDTPISIDTRKADVAEAALDAGAQMVNDVSGFTYDPELAPLCKDRDVAICTMHMRGEPGTMQGDAVYDDVLLDVYDHLAARLDDLTSIGIDAEKIIIDPGIGFAKTLDHNLTLLNRISLFHGLGAPILLGVSRKRFIGTIGNAPQAVNRAPGSIAVALAALAQGVHILRVHDVAETAQAVALWQAVQSGEFDG